MIQVSDIRAERGRHNVTQEEIAQKLGISRATFNEVENDKRDNGFVFEFSDDCGQKIINLIAEVAAEKAA